jgi:hypothetical protein
MIRPDLGNIPKADHRQYYAPDEPEHLEAYLGRDGGDVLDWVSMHPETFNALPDLLTALEDAVKMGSYPAERYADPVSVLRSITADAKAALTKAGYTF